MGEADNASSISSSYATGNVIGDNAVGGLVGGNYSSTITNSYATGNVSGDSQIGGLVGYVSHNVTLSYSTGSVSGTTDVGGLVGNNWGTITNSYWNITTSGQAASAGGSGLTTAQMQQQASFSGFDFTNTWRIYAGNSYPLLKSFLTPLTITASNASKTYDGNAYTGGNGVTYSVAGAGASPNLLGALAYSGTSQGAINAGSYVITPTGLYSNQQGYDISFADGTLTVTAAPPAPPDPTPTPAPAPVVEQQSPLRDHLVSLQAALNMPATSDQQPEHHGLLSMPQSGAVQAGVAMEDGPNRLLMVLNGGIKR